MPLIVIGSIYAVLSLKFIGLNQPEKAEGGAAPVKTDDDDDERNVGMLTVAWIKAVFNVGGLAVYCTMLGIGLAAFPFTMWSGTMTQLQAWYRRRCLKLANTVTFSTKQLRSARKAGEEERDALPVSDPAYTLYVAVLQNPADPFNADMDYMKSVDPNYTPGDDDPDTPAQRRAHLENLNGKDHEEIAQVREAILEAGYDLALAEFQASKADKRLEELLGSQRQGLSPQAIIGGGAAGLCGFFSALLVWFQLMGPIVQSSELNSDISLMPSLFDTDTGMRGFLIVVIYLYFLLVTVWAVVEYRRWFGIYSIGILHDSVLGSVMRMTELFLYIVNPWTYQFLILFGMWSWEQEQEPDVAYMSAYTDMNLLPFFGDIITRWSPFYVAAIAVATLFLNFPAKLQNLINRSKLHDMNEAEFRRKKLREESTKNASAAGSKSEFGIFGNPIEGSELQASGEIMAPGMDVRSADYEWARKKPEETEWQAIPGAALDTYTPTAEDIGYLIQCTATPRTDTNEEGPPVVACITEKIKIALPSIRNLRIEGGPYHTAAYRIRADYVGGIEGDSIKQWFKIKGGVTTGISGATDFVYQPSIDDVACVLKVEYTPVREDGRKGQSQTAESHPLRIDPTVGKTVKNYIVAGSAEFQVLFIDKGAESPRAIVVNEKQFKVRDRKTIKVREELGPHIVVILEPSDPRRFKVLIDEKQTLAFKAESSKERDIVALTIRSFCVMSADRKERKDKGKKDDQ